MKAATLAFALALSAFVVSWLVAALAGPDTMPMHYSLDGTVDDWGTRTQFLVNSAVGLVVVVVLLTLAYFAPRLPTQFVNTPHRDYWLGEHRDEFDGIVRSMKLGMSSVVLCVFTMINIAGLLKSVAGWYFPAMIVLLVLGLAVFIVRPVVRLYREPRGSR